MVRFSKRFYLVYWVNVTKTGHTQLSLPAFLSGIIFGASS